MICRPPHRQEGLVLKDAFAQVLLSGVPLTIPLVLLFVSHTFPFGGVTSCAEVNDVCARKMRADGDQQLVLREQRGDWRCRCVWRGFLRLSAELQPRLPLGVHCGLSRLHLGCCCR